MHLRNFFAFCIAILFIITIPITKSSFALANSRSWMSQVNDDTFLKDLNIPGTHESATASTTIFTCFIASCQSDSISTQLNKGIRFLDLRVNYKDLSLCHGKTDCYKSTFSKLYLKDVFNDINSFLSQNPNETLIIKIADERNGGSTFKSALNKFLSNQDKVYRGGKDLSSLSLRDVRGKVVILAREMQDCTNYSNWSCSNICTLTLGKSHAMLQDIYNETNADIKINHITSFYNQVWNDPDQDNLFLMCFTSCVGGIHTAFGNIPYPKGVAKDINKKFQAYVNSNQNKKFGIVIMDNPPISLIQSIYNLNFDE